MYFYVKALHIIFIVTWFSGLFYIVRLFVYSAEANVKPEPERTILLKQFRYHAKAPVVWYYMAFCNSYLDFWNMDRNIVWQVTWVARGKTFFVLGLFIYHLSLHAIFRQQQNENFRWSSQKLRVWNEVATLFLISIVMLAVVQQLLSVVWGMVVLIGFSGVLLLAIKIYKKYRKD